MDIKSDITTRSTRVDNTGCRSNILLQSLLVLELPWGILKVRGVNLSTCKSFIFIANVPVRDLVSRQILCVSTCFRLANIFLDSLDAFEYRR